MRMLKLVIWDLDETLLTGILEEGDEEVKPMAQTLMKQLNERGILQALATQNPPELIPPALTKFGWVDILVQVEADLGPKAKKVARILDKLDVSPVDTAFVDEDPFERASISAQIPGISSWTMQELQAYLDTFDNGAITEEARRRPQMYREEQARTLKRENADDYTDFLYACQIQMTIRPYLPEDKLRAVELFTRTHRMNLGILPIDETIARLDRPGEHRVMVAEMKDIYGDMGRCGLIQLTPTWAGEALIESLVISCRTRARGLSLAMLIGMLRHPHLSFQQYTCRYWSNGFNRPLRMLLLGAGFKPKAGTDELILSAEQLLKTELPAWLDFNYQTLREKVYQDLAIGSALEK